MRKKFVRDRGLWMKRGDRAGRFWKNYWKDLQTDFFESLCPRGLIGTTKRVNRERSGYDAHDPSEPFLVGMGKTELGALFSLAVQVAARVWWRLGGDISRGPLPACLTRDGKGWRATSCRGLVRDLEPGEEVPKVFELRWVKGKTREDALTRLARELGVPLPKTKERTIASLRADRVEALKQQERPENVAWDELEASMLENGGEW
jgi:hypothetical protein